MTAGGSSKAKAVSLSLYDYNIHQMKDDWRGWIKHIQNTGLTPPDIVLLQDIESDTERQAFERALSDAFGGRWSGRGSEPGWQTAVVWRGTRFWRMTARSWRGFGARTCVADSQDAPAVQVRLWDSRAEKWLSIVSLKTPPEVPDDCAWRNFERVSTSFKSPWNADLYVVGTDSNSPDRDAKAEWGSWFPKLVRSEGMKLTAKPSLNFCDPIVEACEGDRSRLVEHATLRDERLDFLLLRSSSGKPPNVVSALTLPRGKPSKFSDHRSVHAEITY